MNRSEIFDINSWLIILSLMCHQKESIAEIASAITDVTITFLLYLPSSNFTISHIIPIKLNRKIICQVLLIVSTLKIGINPPVCVNITQNIWGATKNAIKNITEMPIPNIDSHFEIPWFLLGQVATEIRGWFFLIELIYITFLSTFC